MPPSKASLVLSVAGEENPFKSVGPKQCRDSELPVDAPRISLSEEVSVRDTG